MSAPTISSISPAIGPVSGGTVVTISGTNLLSPTGVTFGGVAGTVTASTTGSITVTNPTGAGAAAVVVTTAGGTASTTFNYVQAGRISWRHFSHTQGYGWQTNPTGSVQYDARLSWSEAVCQITGVPDNQLTVAALASGLPSAFLPTYDPSDPGLQLLRLTARVYGRNKSADTLFVMLTGRYGPVHWESVLNGIGHMSHRWYTDFSNNPIANPPFYQTWRRSFRIIRFRARFYQQNPPADYTDVVNTIDTTGTFDILDNGVSIFTAKPKANTMMFAGCTMEKVRAGNTSIWVPGFTYHYCPTKTPAGNYGWWMSMPAVNGATPTEVLMYQPAPSSGAFPSMP